MTNSNLVRTFVSSINAGDLATLISLMTEDHVYYVDGEKPMIGKEAMRSAWASYFKLFPKYRIVIDQLYAHENNVIVSGHTHGSHVPEEIETAPNSVLWDAQVRDGLIARWIIYPANPHNRERLGILD